MSSLARRGVARTEHLPVSGVASSAFRTLRARWTGRVAPFDRRAPGAERPGDMRPPELSPRRYASAGAERGDMRPPWSIGGRFAPRARLPWTDAVGVGAR